VWYEPAYERSTLFFDKISFFIYFLADTVVVVVVAVVVVVVAVVVVAVVVVVVAVVVEAILTPKCAHELKININKSMCEWHVCEIQFLSLSLSLTLSLSPFSFHFLSLSRPILFFLI
jgi:hypothetical protein